MSHWEGFISCPRFQNDRKSGLGTYKYANGDVHIGRFKNGQKNGPGTVTFANGDIMEATFVNDKVDGFGKYTYADGSTFEGQINSQGQKTGRGTFYGECSEYFNKSVAKITDEEGNVYEGDVKDGKRHGKGTFKYKNGDSYQGQFFDNMRHGRVICHKIATSLI